MQALNQKVKIPPELMRVAHSLREPEMLHRMLLTSATPHHAHTSISILHLLLLIPDTRIMWPCYPAFLSLGKRPQAKKKYTFFCCVCGRMACERYFVRIFNHLGVPDSSFWVSGSSASSKALSVIVFTTLRLFSPSAYKYGSEPNVKKKMRSVASRPGTFPGPSTSLYRKLSKKQAA